MIAEASAPDPDLREAIGRKEPVTRRVIVEVPTPDPECFGGLTHLGVIESFRVIHLFRFDRKSYAGLYRVKFRDPRVLPSQMVGHIGISKATSLARLADGARLVHLEGRPTAGWARLAALKGGGMYPSFGFRRESWRITVLGSNDQMKKFLTELRHFKMRFKVSSIEDADNPGPFPRSAMEILTPKQRKALVAAYQSGYYDIPKRADSADVARALALGKSTTLEHLRKAEKRLLDHFMDAGAEPSGP
jgi:predicted DNA binding protein